MSIYKGWPNRATHECYDYLESTGDIQNKYIGFVVNHDYGVYQLATRIREDVDLKIDEAIQSIDDDLIANLLYATTYSIDFVEIATEIFHQAQNYI